MPERAADTFPEFRSLRAQRVDELVAPEKGGDVDDDILPFRGVLLVTGWTEVKRR
jgi:hypothetical protein